jgi:phosphotransferase system IIB component
MVPNNNIFLSFIFGSNNNNNNNNNKLGTILNNEASVLERFFQILGMASKYFSEFSANSKIINYCITRLRMIVVYKGVLNRLVRRCEEKNIGQ